MSTPIYADRGDRVRAGILGEFMHREAGFRSAPSVNELADLLKRNKSTIFAHLQFLVRSGVLVQQGRHQARGYALPQDAKIEVAVNAFKAFWVQEEASLSTREPRTIAIAAWMASRRLL